MASFWPLTSATFFASEFATALAISVLPQPGGPYSRIPLGGRSWCSANRSWCRYGSSTASRIISIWPDRPPMLRVVDVREPLRARAPRPRPWGSARRRSRTSARSASESPARMGWSASVSAIRTMRSSSVWPMTSARSPSSSSSLNSTTSPTCSNPMTRTTLRASFSMTSRPRTRSVDLDVGADVHAQLATPGEHVDAGVVVALEEDAVPRGRLRESVDLLLERDDLVAGLAQRGRQALVLGPAGRQLTGRARQGRVPAVLRASSSGHLPARLLLDPTLGSDRPGSGPFAAACCSPALVRVTPPGVPGPTSD